MRVTRVAKAPQVTGGTSMRAPSDNVTPAQPLIMRILVRRAAYRHPRAYGGACLVAGLWLFVLGVILCCYGFWWGALLIAVAALELWIAYHLLVAPLPRRLAVPPSSIPTSADVIGPAISPTRYVANPLLTRMSS